MTAFVGIIAFDGGPFDFETESQISRAIGAARNGRFHARRADGALFVQGTGVTTSGRQGEPPLLTIDNDRIVFAADARLDNRAELAEALAIPPPELARISDGVLILRMYQRWGEAGIARCLGA